MSNSPDCTVLYCTTCQGALQPDAIKDAFLAKLPDNVAVRGVRCMAGCAHASAVGVQGPGRACYLFGDIGSEEDISALAAFVDQYLQSDDGWTNATQRPAQLYRKTLARLPAFVAEGTP